MSRLASKLESALGRLFKRHRIVFWQDENGDFAEEWQSFNLPDVVCTSVENNEFGLKYRMLRQERDRKFLVYRACPPPDEEDGLLDVRLAYGEFHGDRDSLLASELNLPASLKNLVSGYSQFFRSEKRLEELGRLTGPDEDENSLRLKMLAVCTESRPGLDYVLMDLLGELAERGDEKLRLITRVGLAPFLWDLLGRTYGYRPEAWSAEPALKDFALELFRTTLAGQSRLNGEAELFFGRWIQNYESRHAFAALSRLFEKSLPLDRLLRNPDWAVCLDNGAFESIEKRIIEGLLKDLSSWTIKPYEALDIIRKRRESFWSRYPGTGLDRWYAMLETAASLYELLPSLDLNVHDADAAIRKYASVWHRVDQLYRQFWLYARNFYSGELADRVEYRYVEEFLVPLCENFRHALKRDWPVRRINSQRSFYATHVLPQQKSNRKVVVIISDGLRYEVAVELAERLNSENRFTARTEPMLSMLPGITAVGMAALLPNSTLRLEAGSSLSVLVDEQPAGGRENRARILSKIGGVALSAEELAAMNQESLREALKTRVCYIYHEGIDAHAHDRKTEGDTAQACQAALEQLESLVRKLANNNVTNIIITSDHGFLFQQKYDESDSWHKEVHFTGEPKRGTRYLLGEGLDPEGSLLHFSARQLGFAGELEALIPAGLERLPRQGAARRFIHGGATLQEMVIPVLKIHKKREDDIDRVSVSILTRSGTITTSQLLVKFYQEEAVSAKLQPRILRAGLYVQTEEDRYELISNRVELIFDDESKDRENRFQECQFRLSSNASRLHDTEVWLRLEEQTEGTGNYETWLSRPFRLIRQIESDFEL